MPGDWSPSNLIAPIKPESGYAKPFGSKADSFNRTKEEYDNQWINDKWYRGPMLIAGAVVIDCYLQPNATREFHREFLIPHWKPKYTDLELTFVGDVLPLYAYRAKKKDVDSSDKSSDAYGAQNDQKSDQKAAVDKKYDKVQTGVENKTAVPMDAKNTGRNEQGGKNGTKLWTSPSLRAGRDAVKVQDGAPGSPTADAIQATQDFLNKRSEAGSWITTWGYEITLYPFANKDDACLAPVGANEQPGVSTSQYYLDYMQKGWEGWNPQQQKFYFMYGQRKVIKVQYYAGNPIYLKFEVHNPSQSLPAEVKLTVVIRVPNDSGQGIMPDLGVD